MAEEYALADELLAKSKSSIQCLLARGWGWKTVDVDEVTAFSPTTRLRHQKVNNAFVLAPQHKQSQTQEQSALEAQSHCASRSL